MISPCEQFFPKKTTNIADKTLATHHNRQLKIILVHLKLSSLLNGLSLGFNDYGLRYELFFRVSYLKFVLNLSSHPQRDRSHWMSNNLNFWHVFHLKIEQSQA